ncbi:zinc ribbon domain-containing protein [Stygiolobus caldivivus]|uniref:Zinc ribbon domain-containing protein n=1 Tax=Stygiolobus caldivivus TaxID=2824673 RepID=A0A8D5ZJ69_9CREN|nr:zinc ribbon domain-containing protein [Stygiolobus caldivivus]BCU70291.1 zinc ribbon domain-containing protein [Stygiolobus caldivivus]
MSFQPFGYPNSPMGYPNSPMGYASGSMNMMMCMQPVGLGGKQQMIPTQYPVNLQYVAQQVTMYLMGQGFQVFPMNGQNMAIIQAQHTSLFGALTGSNKAYTIRICQGPNYVMVETGMTDLIQDLLPLIASGGVAVLSDEELHNKLLTLLGGGAAAFDAYNVVKDLMQEDQIMNTVMMAVMSAPPLYPTQQPYGQPTAPYSQGYYQPQGYYLPAQQYPQQYSQPQYTQPQYNIQQNVQQSQSNQKCWNCGALVPSGSKFCPSCGASLIPVKCPKCGYINQANAKFCSSCGTQLTQTKQTS